MALTLFEEYRSQGRQVVLLCLEKNNIHSVDGVGVYYLSHQTGYGEGAFKKLASLLVFAIKLKQFVKANGIGWIQSHIYRSNYVNVLARKLGSAHAVQIVNHGVSSRYLGEGLQGKINLSLIRWLYPAADQLICPSRGMLADLKALGVVVSSGHVVGNPFDVKAILQRSQEAVSADEFVFRPDRRYLISVGRLEAVKRPEDIVQALSVLADRYPDLELLLLGTGSEQAAIQVLTKNLGLNQKVHMLGQVPNPFKYMSCCDVFVSASRFEGFSNVIVEALIAGVPVVSTDCPTGPREILVSNSDETGYLSTGNIEKARYGVLVPVGDVDSMVSAIEDSLLSDENRKDNAETGLKRAMDFDTANVANAYMAAFSEVSKY